MTNEVADCPCGSTHEPYTGYYECPYFHTKVDVLAEREETTPRAILSTGKYQQDVSKDALGIID